MQRINGTINLIPEERRHEASLKNIDTLVIKPSEDLSLLAAQHYHEMPLAVKLLLRLIGINQQSDSSIVSYLLFEQSYCSALINLGYQDAMCQIDEIKAFFKIP